jgi:hypothetical protein
VPIIAITMVTVITEHVFVTTDTLEIYVSTGLAIMNVILKVSAEMMVLVNVIKASLDLTVQFLTVLTTAMEEVTASMANVNVPLNTLALIVLKNLVLLTVMEMESAKVVYVFVKTDSMDFRVK